MFHRNHCRSCIWQRSELLVSSYSTLGSEIGLSLALRRTDLITDTVSTQDMCDQSAPCDIVLNKGDFPHTDLLAMFAHRLYIIYGLLPSSQQTMASIEGSDEPGLGSADGAVSADPASGATAMEMSTIDQSYGQSYSALRVTSGEPDWDSEVDNNAARLQLMTTSALPQEPCVKFIAQDETNTDWMKSRLSYSLPLSSAITDLCACIAKEAGE